METAGPGEFVKIGRIETISVHVHGAAMTKAATVVIDNELKAV